MKKLKKHSAPVNASVESAVDVYKVLDQRDVTKEQLVRVSLAVTSLNADLLFDKVFPDSEFTPISKLRNDALAFIGNPKVDSLTSSNLRAVAAANIYDGVVDRDGIYFEVREPFVETNLLPMLYANRDPATNADYYIRRLFYR